MPNHGAAETLEPLRRLMIFQSVSSAATREMRMELEAFMEGSRRRGQMLVVSAGWVPLRTYRECHKAFGRAISRLGEALREKFGQAIQFANAENTYKRRRERAGREPLRLHLHSHIILTGPYLDPARYEEMKLFVREFMAAQGFKRYAHLSKLRFRDDKDEGKRGTVAEALKYSFAPDKGHKSMRKCDQRLRDHEVVALAHITRGLKFFRPAGDFLKFRKSLQGSTWVECEEVVNRITGEVQLDPLGCPVRQWRTVRTPGKRVVRRKDPSGKVVFVTIDRDLGAAPHQVRNDSGQDQDIVLSLQLPAPWAGERMTPSLLVTRYSGDLGA